MFDSDNPSVSCIFHSSFCEKTHTLDAQNSTFLHPLRPFSHFVPSSAHLSIPTLCHYSPYAVACVPHLSQNCYHRCQLPRWKQSHPLLTAKDGREIKKLQQNKKSSWKGGKIKRESGRKLEEKGEG